jgi:hypothetical protein
MKIRGRSERTVHAYGASVCGLAVFHKKPPDQLSDEQTREWLLHLVTVRRPAGSRFNCAVHAVRAFQDWVLGRPRADTVRGVGVAELLTEPAITPVSAARATGINWGAMDPRHRPTESIRRRNETEAIEHRGGIHELIGWGRLHHRRLDTVGEYVAVGETCTDQNWVKIHSGGKTRGNGSSETTFVNRMDAS